MNGNTTRWVAILALVAVTASTTAYLVSTPAARAESDAGWFVSFDMVSVPPVKRSETQQLIELGSIETDGFSELVFSLGGEFKDSVPTSGVVGALLIPDEGMFQYLLRNEGQIVFPLEVQVPVGKGPIFISEPATARVAFPAYRVYLYNDTSSVANATLFIYRNRY